MSYTEYVANSNTAFGSNQFDVALDYAKKAIQSEPKKTEGYYCAGKACMSLSKPAEASDYFQKALDIEPQNGNGFFLLGYSQAMADNTVEALKSLTRALENKCDEALKGQIYKIMSMINTEQGDNENALINIKQAESFMGLDYELLQQKAACYAGMKDYRKTVFTLNQMKLLKPNEYKAYSLAFAVFMELRLYDEAQAELDRAREYAQLDISYYNDRIAYSMLNNPDNDSKDNLKEKWLKTLSAIENGLKNGKPTVNQTFELYLRASQLYISMEKPDEAISCLEASFNPISSFNNDFSVLLGTDKNSSDISVPEGLSPEEEEAYMQEKWDSGEFDEIREKINEALLENGSDDSDEVSEAVQKYLSPTDKLPSARSNDEKYTLSGEFKLNPAQNDARNSLLLSAYEMKKDYDSMLKKAVELQSSSFIGNQYCGIYNELKVGKYRNDDNWQKKYRDRINFWTKKMLADPTDYISASYRIRSYIDLGDFENAEQLCSCLPTEIKGVLKEEINKAKTEGSDNNEHTY